MRILGMILALGAVAWVMLQAGGGDTVVPQGQQQALEKARNLEQSVHEATTQRLQDLEQERE